MTEPHATPARITTYRNGLEVSVTPASDPGLFHITIRHPEVREVYRMLGNPDVDIPKLIQMMPLIARIGI